MILSATSWRTNFFWSITITCTTKPKTCTITQGSVKKTVTFRVVNDPVFKGVFNVSLSTPVRPGKFTVSLNSETRKLVFGDGEDHDNQSSTTYIQAKYDGDDLILPACDPSKLSVSVTRMDTGESLHMESDYRNPWWNARDSSYTTTIDGVEMPHIYLSIHSGSIKFLSSKETGLWTGLNSATFPYRVIINGVSRLGPPDDDISMVIPDRFYNAVYYYDFNTR